eukprot:GHVR01024559.1.p2 GENE.GHVR01024559.1~~GHVR01024559.1.p2  ORF type:complete len:142 (-),score=62.80 GHVR01024559.1:54-479(-)
MCVQMYAFISPYVLIAVEWIEHQIDYCLPVDTNVDEGSLNKGEGDDDDDDTVGTTTHTHTQASGGGGGGCSWSESSRRHGGKSYGAYVIECVESVTDCKDRESLSLMSRVALLPLTLSTRMIRLFAHYAQVFASTPTVPSL